MTNPAALALVCPPTACDGPRPDAALRSTLLECYLASANSAELTEWLREIGQDTKGTVEEKRARVRAHTKYLTMAAEDFPLQTRHYLDPHTSEGLAEMCDSLGLSDEGTREARYRRILREVGYREGWITRVEPAAAAACTKELVAPFVAWWPILKEHEYEREYYEAFAGEMSEVFGEAWVHAQLPVAHGTTLRIDFHIGHPQGAGVGVEFKMPTNNGEVQRALGQIDQYLARYGANLLVVLFPQFLTQAATVFFLDQLRAKGVAVLVKARGY